MSVRIGLTLEASEMFLSLHMIFSLERAATVVRAILERILDFDPSLEMELIKKNSFSHIGQESPFLWLSEILLSRPACLILG